MFGPIYGPIFNKTEEPRPAKRVQELQLLEDRLERALLACEAMWTLVRDKLAVSDVDLLRRINELDVSDGALDGKVRKGAVSCPACHRAIARRFSKCMYCGQEVIHDPFS